MNARTRLSDALYDVQCAAENIVSVDDLPRGIPQVIHLAKVLECAWVVYQAELNPHEGGGQGGGGGVARIDAPPYYFGRPDVAASLSEQVAAKLEAPQPLFMSHAELQEALRKDPQLQKFLDQRTEDVRRCFPILPGFEIKPKAACTHGVREPVEGPCGEVDLVCVDCGVAT
jgi:hypothetical protein